MDHKQSVMKFNQLYNKKIELKPDVKIILPEVKSYNSNNKYKLCRSKPIKRDFIDLLQFMKK